MYGTIFEIKKKKKKETIHYEIDRRKRQLKEKGPTTEKVLMEVNEKEKEIKHESGSTKDVYQKSKWVKVKKKQRNVVKRRIIYGIWKKQNKSM